MSYPLVHLVGFGNSLVASGTWQGRTVVPAVASLVLSSRLLRVGIAYVALSSHRAQSSQTPRCHTLSLSTFWNEHLGPWPVVLPSSPRMHLGRRNAKFWFR